MTSKPRRQRTPLSGKQPKAEGPFKVLEERLDEHRDQSLKVLGLPETEQIASILRVLREQLKNKRLLRDQLRERLASDPLQELAELVSKAHEDMAPAAFRREDMAPAIVAAPSGSMIYMVQKGANTVPDLSFLRNAFTALTARFGTRDP